MQQSYYHAQLRDIRNDEACDFLLTSPNFTQWYNAPGSQQLAILGEMGSGKTVAMAFLVDQLNQKSRYLLPRPKVCYYYCRDNETGQAIHIFAALVLALLEQLSGLKKTFHDWYKEKQESGVLNPATSTRELSEFLEKVVATLDRLLFIVVDGLDECDRASRITLFKLLESVMKKTPRLKIVLSSRPGEEIMAQLEQTAIIYLRSDTHRDAVIVQHTVRNRLSHLPVDVQALVIDNLSSLAQGSAIWMRMVVERIEQKNISAVGSMRRFLEHLPPPSQLSDLYVKLLSQGSLDDPENQELAIQALKILAIACRPLSVEELAWAVALAMASHDVDTVAAVAQRVDRKRVLNLISPFINRVDFKDTKKRQVQLVHQLVKEFTVREWQGL